MSRKSSNLVASRVDLPAEDLHEPNTTERELFAVVGCVLLGDMHDKRAEAPPADQAAHQPPVVKRQDRLPALQAAKAGYQLRIAKTALAGAELFHMVQDCGTTPHHFIGSPVGKGDVIHVLMPVAPEPTGQTVALFDRGGIDHGAARGRGPRVGRSKHGCRTR